MSVSVKKPPAKRSAPTKAPPNPQNSISLQVQQSWAGPLPDPGSLQRFEEIVPGGAERIFNAWEAETAHRHSMERRDLRWAIFESVLGKVLAFLFVCAALGVSAYALFLGHQWFAGILSGATIMSVVSAFVATNR